LRNAGVGDEAKFGFLRVFKRLRDQGLLGEILLLGIISQEDDSS
jgi:hypothetical protein